MKKLLVVVDYQNDFVTGSLGFPKAVEIGPKISEKIKKYRETGGEIVFTMDTHNARYLETQEGKNLPVTHCVENTHGWQVCEIIQDAAPKEFFVFEKPSFGSPALFEFLRKHPYESIELCGVVTDICVISNAVLAKTAQPETPVIVDSSCVASNDDSLGQKALDVMRSLQIRVV